MQLIHHPAPRTKGPPDSPGGAKGDPSTRQASPEGPLSHEPSATLPRSEQQWAERGATHIEDEVVSVIARTAAERVDGVHAIGDSTFRTLLSRFGRHPGIASEVGVREAAVDVDVVVEFGVPIKRVALELRRAIIDAVETMVGLRVIEVNVFVVDITTPPVPGKRRRHLQ